MMVEYRVNAWVHAWASYVSIFANVVLVLIILFKLQDTPSDVRGDLMVIKTMVVDSLDSIEKELSTVRANQVQLRDEFDARGKWVKAIDEEMKHKISDQIFREEFIEWKEELQKRNSTLAVPDISNEKG